MTLLRALLADLGRNRLHSVVTLAGLSLALAAAIVVGLFVRQQYSYEHFIPGYERTFRLTGSIAQPGQAVRISQVSPVELAAALRRQSHNIEAVARITYNFPPLRPEGSQESVRELKFAWADPDFFRAAPFPAIAGNLATALDAPNSVVITRAAARRYFGRDKPLGAWLDLVNAPDRVTRLRVTAVIEDLPVATHFDREVIASGVTTNSDLDFMDKHPNPGVGGGLNYTYVRGKPGVDAVALQRALDAIVKPIQTMAAASGTKIALWATPIADIHFGPSDANLPSAKPTIAPATVFAIGAVGLLILIMAATNYVALMTARAGRRATEVAVRKAAGASRRDLIVQFLGESIAHVLLATLIAMALVELTLPAINAVLEQALRFDLLRDPALLGLILGAALLVALLAGLYPAFVLSSFQPSVALRGGPEGGGGHAAVRQAMVVIQLAILAGLMLSAVTIYRQTRLALDTTLAAGRGPVMLLVLDCAHGGFAQAVRALPGVKGATCSSGGAMNYSPHGGVTVVARGGQRLTPGFVDVDAWFFGTFGIKPIAGRTFSPDHPADSAQHHIVVNETAARHFGFAAPRDAVGQSIALSLEVGDHPKMAQVEIIGVVPDIPASVLEPAGELIYSDWFDNSVLAINSSAQDMPRVRDGVERLWKRYMVGQPFSTNSLEQFVHDRYRGIIVQGKVIAACLVMALIIGGMSLFALATFMTEQRTREIGVRKAMGADSGAIVRLLLWQFSRPVLWAILIAVPIAWWIMARWLEGFANRVDLTAWLFAAAAGATMLVAWSTVAGQAWRVARSRPVTALREE